MEDEIMVTTAEMLQAGGAVRGSNDQKLCVCGAWGRKRVQVEDKEE